MMPQLVRFLTCVALLTGIFYANANAQFTFRGHTYHLTPTVGSWTEAEAFAVSQGAHLVTINDPEENEFIRTTFLTIDGQQEDFWIGLYSPNGPANNASSYEWVSGSPSAYRNFRPGQPDLGSGLDFYCAINFLLNDDGRWDNYPNSEFREIRGIYEVIPEPGTGLLVCGLLTIGLFRRRRFA